MSIILNEGVIKSLYDDIKPMIQILDIESDSEGLYRLRISDGVNTMLATLDKHLDHLVNENGLKSNTIIRLEEYRYTMQGKRTLIISGLDIVKSNHGYKIGNPVELPRISTALSFDPIQQHIETETEPSLQQHTKPDEVDQPNEFIGAAGPSQPVQVAQKSTGTTPDRSDITDRMADLQTKQTDAKKVVSKIENLQCFEKKWKIKVKVIAKSNKLEFKKNEDKNYVQIDLADDFGGRIEAKAFEGHVDKFYDILTIGLTYYIVNGYVQNSYHSNASNPLEIILNQDTRVTCCD